MNFEEKEEISCISSQGTHTEKSVKIDASCQYDDTLPSHRSIECGTEEESLMHLGQEDK